MNIKIRPTVVVIAVGLVIALVWAVITKQSDMVSALAITLAGTLTKLVESEEVTTTGKQ